MESYDQVDVQETAKLFDALDALPFMDADGVSRGTVADQFGPWRQQ
jgi:hypothetical protein